MRLLAAREVNKASTTRIESTAAGWMLTALHVQAILPAMFGRSSHLGSSDTLQHICPEGDLAADC